jgi:CheY-like chemotaxis protein
VEDSDAGVLFISQIVEDIGHQVRVARNGVEATEAMKLRRPDLVVLDLMLPRKSGVAVLQEMKNDPDLKDVPVLIVSGASDVTGVDLKTGEGTQADRQEGVLTHGFGVVLHEQLSALAPDDIVEKPIDPQVLSERLKSLLP